MFFPIRKTLADSNLVNTVIFVAFKSKIPWEYISDFQTVLNDFVPLTVVFLKILNSRSFFGHLLRFRTLKIKFKACCLFKIIHITIVTHYWSVSNQTTTISKLLARLRSFSKECLRTLQPTYHFLIIFFKYKFSQICNNIIIK